jgi:DNA-directed RNA polymerase sigma subunit (sigma70/sigma32)
VYSEKTGGDLTVDDTIELSLLRETLENAMANELHPTERDIIRLRLGLDDNDANENVDWLLQGNNYNNNNNNYGLGVETKKMTKKKRQKDTSSSLSSSSLMKRTCQEVSQHYFNGQLSTAEIRSTEQRAYKKLRSSHVLSSYQLLAYLDFADIDTETMKIR